MLEEQIPTYFVGDLICVAVGLNAGSTERGIYRIVARFVHEADSASQIELSDDPANLSECQVQEPDKVELAGRTLDGVHPPGMYRCKAITAEYPGGRTIRFSTVPDLRFRIAARRPEVVEWRWVSTNGSRRFVD
jgi:hypothetical protein